MPRIPASPKKKPTASRKKAVAVKVAAREAKCGVCGDPVAPFSAEALCWVCRRLKISAWRESDNQASMPD
ncbi:MAG: hypothetical protein IH602_13530 [Bryobacteraceae bacterium]|nr:hypothetical protein [Bryobacteraceae bacterium]